MSVDPAAFYPFKVVMVGDQNVGKTCLAGRFVSHQFCNSTSSTIGATFASRMLRVDGAAVKLQIWDTAGQERFRAIVPLFYREAKGAVVVYDCTDERSFRNARSWIKYSLSHLDGAADFLLLGNKCDRADQRQVDEEAGMELASAGGITFFETSAKDGTNVDTAFEALARAMKDRHEDAGRNLVPWQAVELDDSVASSCCVPCC